MAGDSRQSGPEVSNSATRSGGRLPVATVPLAEAAAALAIGTSSAYRQARAGRFPVPVHRVGGRLLVLRADLERRAPGER
jgi:hypothetical protein